MVRLDVDAIALHRCNGNFSLVVLYFRNIIAEIGGSNIYGKCCGGQFPFGKDVVHAYNAVHFQSVAIDGVGNFVKNVGIEYIYIKPTGKLIFVLEKRHLGGVVNAYTQRFSSDGPFAVGKAQSEVDVGACSRLPF